MPETHRCIQLLSGSLPHNISLSRCLRFRFRNSSAVSMIGWRRDSTLDLLADYGVCPSGAPAGVLRVTVKVQPSESDLVAMNSKPRNG